MKILVCAKVIDGELNPFDESAIECALTLSDDVTVISMGPPSCENVLKPLTRLGVKATLICDNIYAGSDTLATAYILSTAIKKEKYDLILCGRQSIDGDTAQVGPMLSQMLGISLITNALSVKVKGKNMSAKTRMGDEKAKLPSLVTVERGYVLRFPSIFSKAGNVNILDNSILCCNPEKCGLSGSPTKVLQTFENEHGKRKCKFISMEELFPLVERLISAEHIAKETKYAGKKLKSVWAVGKEVLEKAKEISEEVVLIEKSAPEIIAKKTKEEKPDVILWNADLWGRKNAPQVATILDTGLCADCTKLETDGKNLIMYRPAKGGNVTAKIKCIKKPQMATVRTKTESSDIVVAGGKGISDKIEKMYELAEKLGAEIGASRGLVDMDKISYDKQIGLTGKTISPKVYIAIGISGAVQHTCAVEGADTVIAINPDKNARIFKYADYGILCSFD
ncbi:MAG: FAD-binding protein [Firmicutes bacterium]|nr:FAD-binding protein [Bacillota bacterium]